MILQVYTVFDGAVGAHLQPFFCRSKGEAIRSFSEACNDRGKAFYNHPLDFTLVFLGEWDDAGGLFTSYPPLRVISAVECREERVDVSSRGAGSRSVEVERSGKEAAVEVRSAVDVEALKRGFGK